MRSRVAVLRTSASGNERDILVVPLNKMTGEHRTQILDAALKTKDMDNEWFLTKVRERLERCAHACMPLRVWPAHPACVSAAGTDACMGCSEAAWSGAPGGAACMSDEGPEEGTLVMALALS